MQARGCDTIKTVLCADILLAVALANASSSSQQTSTIPWHIQNRYYATEVQFSIFDSAAEIHEELKAIGRDIIPALVLLVDNSKVGA